MTDLPGMLGNVPLAPLTTLGVGGAARWFLDATSAHDVTEAIGWARDAGVDLFVLGGGSNLLISDTGFRGLVVRMRLLGVGVEHAGAHVVVTAGAGEGWDDLVAFSVREGWGGIECLSGIPGSVGATPIQNVGAYGQEVSEAIESVRAIDRRDGSLVDLSASECSFGYRSSRFKEQDRERFVILSVSYRLRPGAPPSIRYPELQAYLEENGLPLDDLGQARDAVIAIRRRKGMVLDPEDPDTRSDGSFFMNPVISRDEFERFIARAEPKVGDGRIPAFPLGDSMKLSAAWLIENAGFHKGYGSGRAGISTKHSLAVVNRGGATSAEILALVREIQGGVRDVFGIELRPEPNFVGFDGPA